MFKTFNEHINFHSVLKRIIIRQIPHAISNDVQPKALYM